ncbi:OLC1v1021172C1 [Oldenlandia corymbosa var. corymbosa]|uniref:OLC1v1021172C1 n=1 Tax=Oldenlandia corymbosa var. corymbosa TaxID=529605 RepID=A0AAV1BWA2_OLDCO|nr:OLC1v1021172C1 [Oldenlandia corymbosa var. corymbosa]
METVARMSITEFQLLTVACLCMGMIIYVTTVDKSCHPRIHPVDPNHPQVVGNARFAIATQNNQTNGHGGQLGLEFKYVIRAEREYQYVCDYIDHLVIEASDGKNGSSLYEAAVRMSNVGFRTLKSLEFFQEMKEKLDFN